MSTLKISEAGTVQFPMVKHAVEIGWTPITPEDARTKRGGEAGTFFRDVLEAKLAAFNPWMSADAVRSVVETLDALPATIEGNRELLAWLRGERQWYDEAEKRHRPVTVIDFEHVADNVFHDVGVEDQAARAQGQPGRRDVRRQRRGCGDRRAQEPEGRRRH
jgi:type I restriction enzyme R subunit